MKLRHYLISLVVFCGTLNTIHAQTTGSKNDMGASERNRQDKDLSILVHPVGFGPTGTITQGLTLGFFINPNSVINIELKNGKKFSFLGDILGQYRVNQSSLGIYYKQFTNTSFYFKAGVDYRTVDYSYNYTGWFNSTENTQFIGSSTALTFAIGNHWQFSNFTLGCDWVGINLPIIYQTISESTDGSAQNPTRLADEKDNYLKKSSLLVTNFYLGFSF
ncbi:MAG: hypothetical protein WA160_14375 [Pseudobdellovibrio sp.]